MRSFICKIALACVMTGTVLAVAPPTTSGQVIVGPRVVRYRDYDGYRNWRWHGHDHRPYYRYRYGYRPYVYPAPSYVYPYQAYPYQYGYPPYYSNRYYAQPYGYRYGTAVRVGPLGVQLY